MSAPHSKHRTGAAAMIGLILSFTATTCAAASNGKEVRIRLALSDTLFLNINENDARAAVRAWTESVAGPSHLEIEGGAQLMRSGEIEHAIANHLIDAFSITVPEYAKVARFVDPVIFMDEGSAQSGFEYVILARQDSGIHDLSGLRGRSLIAWDHPSMCLALPWLETLLAASNLGSTDRFFNGITKSTKPTQTVLPVFFGRADACLVTRRAFDMMSELNPQLRQKLQVIAMSLKLLTVFVGVHRDSTVAVKTRMREAVLSIDNTPSGHQILTLFESHRLVALDSSVLSRSVDLIVAYDQLNTRRPGGNR